MSAATALTQSNVADALRRALDDEANKKDGKWTPSGEAAATSGVIDFLQKYMKDDAKIINMKTTPRHEATWPRPWRYSGTWQPLDGACSVRSTRIP